MILESYRPDFTQNLKSHTKNQLIINIKDQENNLQKA